METHQMIRFQSVRLNHYFAIIITKIIIICRYNKAVLPMTTLFFKTGFLIQCCRINIKRIKTEVGIF